MAHNAQQRDGIQLDRGGAVATGEQHADNVAPERSPDLTVANEAETIRPTAGRAPDSTGEDWRRVLRFLADGDDREEAVYERARNRLLQFFAARGKLGDEELADATFDRVVAKLSDEIAEQVRSPVGYMLRFAHFIYLEHLKSEIARRSRLAALQFNDADRTESAQEQWLRDERLALLERCLNDLPPADRDLLLSYYTHDRRSRIVSRQKLSLELGITPTLLRTRVSRLLTSLNQRVRALAEEAELA
jgi:DNA-directed RNA polymerase specialized sigma24 family protein